MRINIKGMKSLGFEVHIDKLERNVDIVPINPLGLNLAELGVQLYDAGLTNIQKESILTTVHMEAHSLCIMNAIYASGESND